MVDHRRRKRLRISRDSHLECRPAADLNEELGRLLHLVDVVRRGPELLLNDEHGDGTPEVREGGRSVEAHSTTGGPLAEEEVGGGEGDARLADDEVAEDV